ncbi:endolytic transglycosylase MltG [Halopseudomonas pelagia]|uniref:endolytic transglycosylase MltG n=1 Tax=Halopseudomonas pelagia TaxID=553151 RepID=UPI001E35014D|nr:endolytic transglycosylase MltG [Halopseudomonas pelagia]
MKSILRLFRLLFVLTLFLVGGLALWGYFTLQSALDQPLQVELVQNLDVPSGSSPARIFSRLEQDGILHSSEWLRRYWQWQKPDAVLQVGEYVMEPGMTAEDLLQRLANAEVLQRSVTLVEGWTFKQVRDQLSRAERLQQTLDPDWSMEKVMDELGLKGVHAEGQFFPDTYQYTFGMSDRDILLRAYERMQHVLEEAWASRAENLPIKTPYEALILASIIERETGVPHERDEIAGVFTRRLQIGMRLQTDPTVIYGMGDDYEGRIRLRHLREPTAYNTYTIDGLPPTPIAMPGREALIAAVTPKKGSSLYFVAKGDGSHVFSNSLQEHNQAVRRFQIEQRAADYRSSPAPADQTEEAEQ